MTAESFLSKKLQKFSILDLALVKSVYFVFGFLIFALYPNLSALDWWFYLVLLIMCAMPLEVHLFSQKGSLVKKMHAFLKTNNPSNQVLLFLSVFFSACMLGVLLPVLVSGPWWLYVIIIVPLAVKPMTKTWFW